MERGIPIEAGTVTDRATRRGPVGRMAGWAAGVLATSLVVAACSGSPGANGGNGGNGADGGSGPGGVGGVGGSIDLALTTGCEPDSAPECVEAGGTHVLDPGAYERAGVASAELGDGDTIAVQLDDAGAAMLEDLSQEAADSGDRLLMRAGNEVVGAPAVMEPLTGGAVQLTFTSAQEAERVLALIQGS
ncbi:hypothetical protein GCG21_06020 [Pseudactinotalea sp. HY160]|uniref:hypothetical protein n=1 Tax=Pseudactinotalea sp. HY160 TaxID=2654490 RepID=UPI00128E7250|nr:hypothetical protein [Pseudactinotalea sp. HY160]MPV49568.1 hypothetical protein [Pseudactinotalea sp. HY160]